MTDRSEMFWISQNPTSFWMAENTKWSAIFAVKIHPHLLTKVVFLFLLVTVLRGIRGRQRICTGWMLCSCRRGCASLVLAGCCIRAGMVVPDSHWLDAVFMLLVSDS
ncbi:hypothetical protein LSAT2_008948 [Lamellibrachia satsuma]|nr:hypothetical protein LSAT2_008948 [Lamellibrachia satsuma]